MCEQRQNTQTRLETSQLYLFVVENIVKTLTYQTQYTYLTFSIQLWNTFKFKIKLQNIILL